MEEEDIPEMQIGRLEDPEYFSPEEIERLLAEAEDPERTTPAPVPTFGPQPTAPPSNLPPARFPVPQTPPERVSPAPAPGVSVSAPTAWWPSREPVGPLPQPRPVSAAPVAPGTTRTPSGGMIVPYQPAAPSPLSLSLPTPPSQQAMSPFRTEGALLEQRLIDERTRLLREAVPSERVSRRPGPGGRMVSFITGRVAIEMMNEVFGYGGWSSEIREIVTAPPIRVPSKAKGPQWQLSARVIVRVILKLEGTYHEGIGFDTKFDSDQQAGMENAIKGAETDGLKRAIRKIGQRVGLSIY